MKKLVLIVLGIGISTLVNAADLVGVISDENVGLSDGSIDLSISGGVAPFTISWSGPSGYTATSEDISGLVAGDYTVTVIDSYCGEASYTFTVEEVSNGANIVEKEAFAVSVYPNPTNGILYFETSEIITIELYTITGELILVKENAKFIDLEKQTSGNYLIKIISEKGTINRKIIKH